MEDGAGQMGGEGEERRTELRHSRIKGAKIVYRDGHCVFDCTLRNLSETGALIQMDVMVELPATFWIHFTDGTPKREVELIWRKGNRLGVRFLDATGLNAGRPSSSSAKYAILDRITLIEKQLAELRRELTILLHD